MSDATVLAVGTEERSSAALLSRLSAMMFLQYLDIFTTTLADQTHRDWTAIWLACAVPCAACVATLVLLFPTGAEQNRET